MKPSPLRKSGKSEVAKAKVRIQALLRECALIRDGGCVLRDVQALGDLSEHEYLPVCGGYTKDGNLILQFDHLNSREHNISYGVLDLGVIVCKAHHGWKHFSDNNKKLYDSFIRKIIGKKRTALWDRCEADRGSYPMGAWEWAKVELLLRAQLKELQK